MMYADASRFPRIHLDTKGVTEAIGLPEYSATIPTGTTPGKRWKRHDGAYDPSVNDPFWIIGEYGPEVDGYVKIFYHRPTVRVKALTDCMITIKAWHTAMMGDYCQKTFGYKPKVLSLRLTPFDRENKLVLVFKKSADAIIMKMWLSKNV